jgi:hypothetical protein
MFPRELGDLCVRRAHNWGLPKIMTAPRVHEMMVLNALDTSLGSSICTYYSEHSCGDVMGIVTRL